jgi:PHP family Zn ribbon phosphoesterase
LNDEIPPMPIPAKPTLRRFRADLHIHTALSPCGSEEMTPAAIIAAAQGQGLDMIAICDHNSAGNVGAVMEANRQAGSALTVLAGIELTSSEEVHVVGLFPDVNAADRAAGRLRALLPEAGPDYHSFFGEQSLLTPDGSVVGLETVPLAFATSLDLSDTVRVVHDEGGLAVAAHVDRRSFSVYSQLGFFPADAGFDAVELSLQRRPDPLRGAELARLGLPMIASSDSHFPDEVGRAYAELRAVEPTFAELSLAFGGDGGRSVMPVWRCPDA